MPMCVGAKERMPVITEGRRCKDVKKTLYLPTEIAEQSYSLSPGGRRSVDEMLVETPLPSRPLERTRGPAGPPNGDRTDTGRKPACCCCPAELVDEFDADEDGGAGEGVARVSEGARSTGASGCG